MKSTSAARMRRACLESLESRRLFSAAVWTGAGTDSLFSDAANWQGDAVPTSGQAILFPSGVTNTTVTIDSNVTLGNVEFDASYTLAPPNSSDNSITLEGNVLATVGNEIINDPVILSQNSTFTTYPLAGVNMNAPISDGGHGYGLTVEGNGPLTLAGDGETYTGATTVQGGLLYSVTSLTSAVSLTQGSSFIDSGEFESVGGYGATFSPADGSGPGAATIVNNLDFSPNTGDIFAVDIGGPTDSSLVTVQSGTIALGNATLTAGVIDGYTPAAGDVIDLIQNQTGNPISGTFNNLPQGATTVIEGKDYIVSYVGGSSGHDVTLTAVTGTLPTIVSATQTASTHGYTIGASVVGADTSSAGAAGLTYTWTAIHLPAGAKNPTYSANGTNAAKNVIARFYKDGGYVLQCTVKNAAGNSVTTDVDVTVSQKATSIKIEPHKAVIAKRGTEHYTATVLDQFGHAMRTAQTIAYAVAAGPGSINSTGLFTAGNVAGGLTVEVEADELSATVGALIS